MNIKGALRLTLLFVPLTLSPLSVTAEGTAAGTAPSTAAKPIETEKTEQFVRKIEQANEAEWLDLYKDYLKSAEDYQPFAAYAVANALLKRGKRGDAAFWYGVGKLRASYDAVRCSDVTARRALMYLEERYPELSVNLKCRYERIHEGLTMALAWDEKRPYRYDHRWVNLFTLTAPSGEEMTLPESTWRQLRMTTRNEIAATLRTIEQQGKERWEENQRQSAKKGLEDFAATEKRARERHEAELEKRLEGMKRLAKALEACLNEK